MATGQEPPLLLAEAICHEFPGPSGNLRAIANITLAVGPGEFLAIVGPSGSGKTTLLRILGGLIAPDQGRVVFGGRDLYEGGAARERLPIGFVFQQPNLLPWRTVLGNVRLPLEVRGVPTQEANAQAMAMLELVGLADFGGARPGTLSGGMQQRAALARGLVGNPSLLLLDEPFGALDALLRIEMNLELVRLWQARQPTVVLITHDIAEAVFVADRVVALSPRPGRIVANVPIELPRPRQAEDRYGPGAQAYIKSIYQVLGRQPAGPLPDSTGMEAL